MNQLWLNIFNKAKNNATNAANATDGGIKEDDIESSGRYSSSDDDVSSGASGTHKRFKRDGAGVDPSLVSDLQGHSGRSRDHGNFRRRRAFITKRILGVVRKSKRNSYFFSSVARFDKPEEVTEVLQRFVKPKGLDFQWAIEHGDHWHFVHDCKWSNRSCRCFGEPIGQRRTGQMGKAIEFSEQNLRNVVNYHFADGRRVQDCKIKGGDYAKLFRGLEDLPKAECDTDGLMECSGDVEESLSANENVGGPSEGSGDIDVGGEGNSQGNRTVRSAKRSREWYKQVTETQKAQVALEKLILRIARVPLSDYYTTDLFIESDWRFKNPMSVVFKNALTTIKLKFFNFEMRDYKYFYLNRLNLPYWDTSKRSDLEEHYLNLQMSKKYALRLLIWQYAPESMDIEFNVIDDNWKKPVFEYLKSLMNLLDKNRGKQNTDYYISAPNAGKTLFMDMIRDYMINAGQMSNWNRNSSFPLQTCGYTRVIFWNEPNYEESVERNLLKLLGGDSLNAAIKNMNDAIIVKTPVIVTSNNRVFPNKPEFECRIKTHIWKSADFLKDISGKKFHPLALLYLFNSTDNYFEEDIFKYHLKYTDNKMLDLDIDAPVFDSIYAEITSSEAGSSSDSDNNDIL
uniref:Nonstructural protein 1 n=1 Tax=Phylloscopus inornatus parvoviridae sp. TaxID=2794539 RepID=A0A8A4XCT5_9VIRU|nr:MAG: nonstructural protein 1 [Phylloscopus inornatus parvoviridae sp.]